MMSPRHGIRRQGPYQTYDRHRVVLTRFATGMGFTLAEIKLFLSALGDNTPVGPRWKNLATRKLIEVDQTIARARELKSLLQGLLHCHCPSLQFCVNRLSLSPNLRFLSQRHK